MGFSRR